MAAKKKAARKKVAKKVARRKTAAKRELIDTGSNKLFVRRNARGTSFKEVVDVSKSLAADRRQHAKTVAKPGQGDKGDLVPSASPAPQESTRSTSSRILVSRHALLREHGRDRRRSSTMD